MNYKIISKPGIYLPLLISILLLSGPRGSTQENTFSIMTWNIWHGGLHGSAEHNFAKDSSHTINTIKIIQEANPDILLMQETYCCGMNIARAAGLPYSWRASSNLSIHSRYPIVDTLHLFKPFNSMGIVVNINGTDVYVFNLWLHYLPDYMVNAATQTPYQMVADEKDTRWNEIEQITEAIKNIAPVTPNTPVIIGGDFNSGSHLDWTEASKPLHYNKKVDWPVSQVMLNNGYVDSFRKLHPDPYAEPAVTNRFLDKEILSDRIDYIYYKSKKLTPISSRIIKEDPQNGFFNSDHRAVLTHFSLHD